jgi:hypothetical protein
MHQKPCSKACNEPSKAPSTLSVLLPRNKLSEKKKNPPKIYSAANKPNQKWNANGDADDKKRKEREGSTFI